MGNRKKGKKEINWTGFSPALKSIIGDATRVGYRAYDIGFGGVQLVPGNVAYPHILIPRLRSINQHRMDSIIRQVVRYADQDLMEKYREEYEAMDIEEREALKAVAHVLFNTNDEDSQVSLAVSGLDPEPEPKPEPVDHEEDEEVWPKVRPFYARLKPGKDGGIRYKSTAMNIRTHKDGHEDYECTVCGYTGTKMQVAGHRSHHVQKGEAEGRIKHSAEERVIDPDYTEPMYSRNTHGDPIEEYKPTERLLNALKEFLDDHMPDNIGHAELARLFLAWMRTRPDLEREEIVTGTKSDDSPESILSRIRLLVAGPVETELSVERKLNASLKERIAELEAQVEASKDKRNWKAMAEDYKDKFEAAKQREAGERKENAALRAQIQELEARIQKHMDDRAALADLLKGAFE
jgi:BMFP domain-containing protein YqiC